LTLISLNIQYYDHNIPVYRLRPQHSTNYVNKLENFSCQRAFGTVLSDHAALHWWRPTGNERSIVDCVETRNQWLFTCPGSPSRDHNYQRQRSARSRSNTQFWALTSIRKPSAQLVLK